MKTQRILTALIAATALFVTGTAISAQAQAAGKRRPRIAVMDFDYGTVQSASSALFGTDVDIGKGIVDLLVTGLVKDGTYSVIERKALDKIMAEQNFSNSNRADPTSAARIGKMLGVDAIIVGSITEFGNETKKTNLGGTGGTWHGFGLGGIGHSNSKANVAITARIVDVDTGEILGVADGKGQSARASTSLLGGAVTGAGLAAGMPTSVPATSRTPSLAKPQRKRSMNWRSISMRIHPRSAFAPSPLKALWPTLKATRSSSTWAEKPGSRWAISSTSNA